MSKLKMYCPSCGSLNLYAGEKPRFCQSCGFSFSYSGEQVENVQEDENSELEDIPNISKLDVDIQRYEAPKETLGQVAGTASPETNRIKSQPNSSPRTSEEILAEFQREAGTRGRDNNG